MLDGLRIIEVFINPKYLRKHNTRFMCIRVEKDIINFYIF